MEWQQEGDLWMKVGELSLGTLCLEGHTKFLRQSISGTCAYGVQEAVDRGERVLQHAKPGII